MRFPCASHAHGALVVKDQILDIVQGACLFNIVVLTVYGIARRQLILL